MPTNVHPPAGFGKGVNDYLNDYVKVADAKGVHGGPDTQSTGADPTGELTGGPLDKPGTLWARDGSRPADFSDPESQRLLDATARTLARELGHQAARKFFTEMTRGMFPG